MAWFGTIWLWGDFLNKPGRKPIQIGLLNSWEFEWNKALHLLRDGAQVPAPRWVDPDLAGLTSREIDANIRLLKQLKAEDVVAEWARRQGKSLKPMQVYLHFAADFIAERIAAFEQLKPRKILALADRRSIWDALIRAQILQAVRQACDHWEHLADVRAAGMAVYPAHIIANADAFLAMKRNKRFPLAPYADDSRLEYLARGMAGVMVGVSPMTAIERLRNMKHVKGGPLRSDSTKVCQCWRCEATQFSAAMKMLGKVELVPRKAGQE